MQKKKKLYIIIMIIATVLLIADVIVFVVSKPSFAGGRGDNMEKFQMEEMPGGMEMPKGMEMPEGMEMPGGMEMPKAAGDIGILRIICIVVGIICILADVFCGVKLLKICKQEKENPLQIEGDDEAKKIIEEVVDPAAERMKKQKKGRRVMMAVIAILLVIVLILQTLSKGVKESSNASVREEVITAQAENGDISQTLKSSGVLAAADSENVNVPGEIKVTEYLVSNGDTVAKGDAIASVDKNSVLAAIADVQELIKAIDEEISIQKEASISSCMKATVGGTVVAVYAKENKDVVDVMYEKGALMLISLDDLLAVTIQNPGGLTVGDKVKVIDSDKNKHTGKVVSIEKDTIEITVSLDDFNLNEKVTVKNAEGKKLGKGKLYVYSQQKITGYSGTISDVNVEKGDTVKAGTTLLTLENTDYTAAYQTLMNKRIALEDQYNRLVEIAGTGYVYVKEAGTISGIDEELMQTSMTGNYAAVLEYLTDTDDSGEVEVPENGNGEETEMPEDNNIDQIVTTSKSVNVVWLNSDGSVMTTGYPECITVELFADGVVADTVEISEAIEWTYAWTELPTATENGTEIMYTIAAKEAVDGYSTVTQTAGTVTVIINTKKAENVQPPSEDDQPENPETQPENPETQPENPETQPENPETQPENPEIQPENPGNQQGVPEVQPENPDDQQGVQDSQPEKPEVQPENPGDQQGMPEGQQGKPEGMGNPTGQNMTGMPSGFNVAGAEGSSVMTSIMTEEEDDPTYVFGETTLCALTPDDGVKIDITVDELDILDIFMGQECEVTMDAFPGQSFAGKVSGIGQSGTSSGGNAKYTVAISMTKEKDMLLGMNASVSLVTNTEKDVLMIPEAALAEQDGKVYIYTEYDEKNDELGGMTEVTTGLSDGQNVQILEGLESGKEYCYRYADTISYSFVK